MKNKLYLKIISIILIISLIVQNVPITIFAKSVTKTAMQSENDEKAVYVLYEECDLREENTKHFRMSDGSYTAVTYGVPIHYLNEDGAYKDIDNTLEKTDEGYKTNDNPFSVILPEESDGEVVIQHSEKKLSFKILDSKKAKTKVKESKNKTQEEVEKQAQKAKKEKDKAEILNSDKYALKKYSSGVAYEEVFDGTDISYDIDGTVLKESIILNKKNERNGYVYSFTYTGLSAVLNEDNSVSFFDGETEYFILAAPYMFDSANKYSTDIEVKLTATDTGCTYELIPNKKWLNDKEREYPITIDPTVSPTLKATEIKDATAVFTNYSSGLDNWAKSYPRNEEISFSGIKDYSFLAIGKYANNEVGSCIYADIPDNIPDTARIINATLNIASAYSLYDADIIKNVRLNAYVITSDWNTGNINEESILFNTSNPAGHTIPNTETEAIDYRYLSEGIGNYHDINITKAAQYWHNGGNNYGIMLKMDEYSLNNNCLIAFYSSDFNISGVTNRPLFVYTYRDTSGLEDYWSYHSVSSGNAGTGYINDFNGNLTFIHNDTNHVNERYNISLAHVYNSNNSSVNTGYGNGWRLNIGQISNEEIDGETYYCYLDSDSTKHYFYNDDGTYKDEDGIGYVLSFVTGDYVYKITTKSHETLFFNANGKLCKFADSNSNTVEFCYDSDYLKTIKAGAESVITLSYTNNKLSSVSNLKTNRVTNYTYDTDGNLICITQGFDNNESETYNYTYSGMLLASATDDTGYRITYDYISQSAIKRVYCISESVLDVNNQRINGQVMTFSYKNGNQTVVEDSGLDADILTTSDNNKMTYQFDVYGQPVSVYDEDGRGASYKFSDIDNQQHNLTLSSASYGYIPGGCFIKDSEFYYGNAFWDYSECADFNGSIVTLQNGAQISQTITLDKGSYKATADYTIFTDGAKGRIKAVFPNNETVVSSSCATSGSYIDELVIEVENNDTPVTVIFEECGNGTVQLYSPFLYKMPYSSKINYVTNGSFEYEKEYYESICDWDTSLAAINANFPIKEEYDGGFGNVLELLAICTPTTGMQNKVFCNPNVSGNAGEVLLLSGWAKATAIDNDSSTFALELKITHTDGTTDTKRLDFNNNVTEWQFGSLAVPVQKDFSGVTVTVDYVYQLNNGYFDDIQLIKDDAISYVYDEDGNVISAKTSATKEQYEYDGNSRITSVIDSVGRNFKYNYDDNHNLISAVSDSATTVRYTYNSYGEATLSETYANTQYKTPEDNGNYYIFLRSTGLYLSLNDNVNNDRFNSTSYNQKFYVEKQSDGYFTLYVTNGTTKRYLAVENSSGTYATAIVTADNENTTRFKFERDKNGGYRIIPKADATLCIDNATNATSNNAALTVSAINEQGNNQVWYFESAEFRESTPVIKENCVYAIRNFNNGTYIAPSNNIAGSNLVLNAGDYNSGKFYLEKYEETEYYNIRISGSDLVLALNEAGNGVVVEEHYDGDDYQLFSVTVHESDPAGYAVCSVSICPKLAPTSYLMEFAGNLMVGEMSGHWRSYWFFEELLYSTSSASYNNDGTKLSVTKDTATGAFTKYFYDSIGRVKKVLTNSGSTTNEYDGKDRVKKVTSGNSSVGYVYNSKNQLSKINVATGNGTQSYSFDYDAFGNNTEISVGNSILSRYSYIGNTGLTSSMIYGNNDTIEYTYDDDYRVTQKVFTDKNTLGNILGNSTVKYEYDIFGNVYKLTDGFTGKTTSYKYDLLGRINCIYISDGTSRTVTYDALDRINGYSVSVLGKNIDFSINYGEFGQVNSFTNTIGSRSDTICYTYDDFYRRTGRSISGVGGASEYVYLKGAGGQDTILVETFKNGKDTYSYTYDSTGNITSISKNGTTLESYTYDSLNQLTKIVNGNDIYSYAYDIAGNIQSVKKNGVIIKSYSYTDSNRTDLLTAYNGTNISYDEIGNPLNWRNDMDFSWSYGRRLTSVTDDNNSISYTYNSDGLRTSKTVNGATTEYYWLEGILQGQKTGNEHILFLYDENGSAYGLLITDNGTESYYYYLYNLQGDIVGIMDSTGETVTEYTYDAWGNLLTVTGNTELGNKNPLRYRGYYYDNETGLYLTGTRYYDPEIGRFINADGYVSTGQGILGTNMFAYCGNNPVNRVDPTGQFWSEIWEFAKTAVAEIGKAMGVVSPAYAWCGGVAVADGPLPFGDIVAAAGAALITVGAIGYGIYQAAQAPSSSIPKADTKEKDITDPPPSNGTTYYHVTTPDNAVAIMTTCIMTGSKWESGYVYAWKTNPSKYAIKNSGAHLGVTISFKTSASFVMDTGITDPKVQMYGPVVSTMPGPIVVWDVRIVG